MNAVADTHALVDGLFRRESARLVASLARQLGLARLELVEDAVHDALVAALRHWPLRGVPERPEAWLAEVARRRAIDRLRGERVRERARDDSALATLAATGDASDDQLAMLFACCDPRLPLESRVALALKTLCGLSVREIARACHASDAAIEQRITRSKQRIAKERIDLQMPPEHELPDRLQAVGEVLYAMFATGHAAGAGAELTRPELVREAIRLGELLFELEPLRCPETHALLALFWLHASRLPARQDERGEVLTLAEQDRSRWDRAAIARGFAHLERAATGDRVSRWHVEASIASCHAMARDAASTDWPRILAAYDELCANWPSPFARLSRAVALARVEGPSAGLRELASPDLCGELARHHLLPAARGELQAQLGDLSSAAVAFREALALAPTEPERRYFVRRLSDHGFEP